MMPGPNGELKARLADMDAFLGDTSPDRVNSYEHCGNIHSAVETVEGNRKKYCVTGTGYYRPLLAEPLTPFHSSQDLCSVEVEFPMGKGRTSNIWRL
jgi:hypothetical protein